jgi:hypothetical protein
MKTKYHIIIVFVVICIGMLPFNACNFLDVDDYFNETLKYDSIFTSQRNIERYLWGAANAFPNEGQIFFGGAYTPGVTATDEAFSLGASYTGVDYLSGIYTASSNPYNSFYGNMYKVIRKANTIFARMDEAGDLTNSEKQLLRSYTHFLRGYAYYQMLMLYGPVVIIGEDLLETNEEPEYYDRARDTYDDCVEYICSELEQAAVFLPGTHPAQYYGRPTRGAALALVARLRLIHASPLYNGGSAARSVFGDFRRTSDGAYYIRQEYDERRWAVAAMAAKRVIDLQQYELHWIERYGESKPFPEAIQNLDVARWPFPLGSINVDGYRSYKNIFDGEMMPTKNPEIIWGCNSSPVSENSSRCFPTEQFRGYNNMSITQKVVDAYRMDDGRTIEEAIVDGYYSETGTMSGTENFSGYKLNPAANGGDNLNVHNMYKNREMRFYASVHFDGVWFDGLTSSNTGVKEKKVSYQYSGWGGKSKESSPGNYTTSGYTLRKYVHPDDNPSGSEGARMTGKHFPTIRYAEILLSYAEALNRLTQTHTVRDEVYGEDYVLSRDMTSNAYGVNDIAFYFNQIRYRVCLPGLKPEEVNDPETFQSLIERERMIEFMCENRRYFDVRRWGIYQQTEREPMLGMNVDVDGDAYYTRVPLNHATARERQYGSDNAKYILLPLPLNEIRKVAGLDQNPEWEK